MTVSQDVKLSKDYNWIPRLRYPIPESGYFDGGRVGPVDRVKSTVSFR